MPKKAEPFLFKHEVCESTGCWIWKRAVSKDGYGFHTQGGKLLRAHRWAWVVNHGEIPENIQVLHKCDNRLCVNPDHLFLGTHQDNMKDKVQKKRNCRGSNHGSAKLSDEQILSIAADTRRQHIIAKQYRVAQITVSDIQRIKHGGIFLGHPPDGEEPRHANPLLLSLLFE